MSSRGQNPVSPTFSKLTEGAHVKEINEEKQKIPNFILQELEPSFKVSTSSLQQQRWQIPNVDIDHSCTKDGSRNGVFTRESHAACSKRSVAKVNPSRKKHLKSVVSINEEHIRVTPALPDSI